MIARIRTVLFRIAFYSASVPIVLAAPAALPFGQRAVFRYAHGWVRTHRFLARWILGIRVRQTGVVPHGPTLFVSKHETMFETFELVDRIDGPLIVLKQELLRIPVWGRIAKAYGAIGLDRTAGATALRALLRDVATARATGRSVLIFAEGTRVRHGDTPPLKSGFVALYKAFGLPVVPIATDSGRLMPKGDVARPGILTLRFGDQLPAGLRRDEIERAVHTAINVLNTIPATHGDIADTAGQ